MVFWTTVHFSNVEYWGCPSKVNNAMLAYSIAKKWKWYCQYHQKTTILWEKQKIIWKRPQCPWENTSRFLPGREIRKTPGSVGIFCQNLGITALCFKQNFPILKVNLHSTVAVLLKYMIISELWEMPDLMICLN